jgi:hypothetical protein
MSHSVNQPTNQSINQSINRSIDHQSKNTCLFRARSSCKFNIVFTSLLTALSDLAYGTGSNATTAVTKCCDYYIYKGAILVPCDTPFFACLREGSPERLTDDSCRQSAMFLVIWVSVTVLHRSYIYLFQKMPECCRIVELSYPQSTLFSSLPHQNNAIASVFGTRVTLQNTFRTLEMLATIQFKSFYLCRPPTKKKINGVQKYNFQVVLYGCGT